MKIKALLLGIGLLSIGADAASADVVIGNQLWTTGGATVLDLTPVVPGGNQPLNNPCLICGTNQPAQPANFGYNNFDATGNVSEYLMFSTATVGGSLGQDTIGTGYAIGTGSVFRNYLLSKSDLNLTFSIGIDVNDTNKAQTLESFYFLNLTQHTVLAAFSPEPGGVPVLAPNNGTGFPDYTLSGFNLNRGDLGCVANGSGGVNCDQILFFARWSGANDGAESFFLVAEPSVADVPEASTWAMLVLGFAGIGGVAMRRNRKLRLA